MSKIKMKLGHSPDADDAFMFYGIASGKVSSEMIEFEHVIEEIQALNKRALSGELEVTAISAHGYLHVQDNYRILSCGASMGDGYGPILVSKTPTETPVQDFGGSRVGVPGMLTTAYLLLGIYADDFIPIEMPFDQVMNSVIAGEVDVGLLIHEGQLTYEEHGLEKVLDLGVLWEEETSLPMPLGLNVVRRDIDDHLQKEILRVHRNSIEYGLDNKKEALRYALQYGRGMEEGLAEEFVLMYVNDLTRDMGERGKKALETLYSKALDKKLIGREARLDVLE